MAKVLMSSYHESQGFKTEFLAGTVAGLGRLYLGQPFDIVKVRMQSANNNKLTSWQVTKAVYAENGILGFWKGTLYPLLGIGGTVSIQFGVNENIKKRWENKKGSQLSFSELFICGASAGFASSFVSTPVEHLRIRMQTQPKDNPIYKGSLDCMKQIYNKYGINAIFKGAASTTVREIVGYGTFFATYAWLTRLCMKPGQTLRDLSYFTVLWTGSLTGIAFWNSMFIFDTVKTKIQTDSFDNPKYKNMWDCAQKTYKSVGFKGFFPGYIPCMLRAIPVNGGIFVFYEAFYRYLVSHKPQKTN
jgi:solute carrier family 25 carnitine/acylcarnitine transporter 20/29